MPTVAENFDKAPWKPKGAASGEEVERLGRVTELVRLCVDEAQDQLRNGKINDWSGPFFDALREFGRRISQNELSEELLDEEDQDQDLTASMEEDEKAPAFGAIEEQTSQLDPRRALGYAIEERAYYLLESQYSGKMGDWQAQFSRILPTYTRPDIVIFLDKQREGLIDITAEDSRGHICGKGGGIWFTSDFIVWTCEVLYESFKFEEAKIIAAAAWQQVDEETYKAVKGKAEKFYQEREERRREQAEEEFKLWLEDREAYCREYGFHEAGTKKVRTIDKFRARLRLYDLGVRDERLGGRKRKQISETQMDKRKKEKNKMEKDRLAKKMNNPLYKTKLQENRDERKRKEKLKEQQAIQQQLALTGTRSRKPPSHLG